MGGYGDALGFRDWSEQGVSVGVACLNSTWDNVPAIGTEANDYPCSTRSLPPVTYS